MVGRKRDVNYWIERYRKAKERYDDALAEMEKRERIYRGERSIDRTVPGDRTKTTTQVRNIAAELVEAVVDTAIPQPRVTAIRERDRGLALKIEEMLKCELDRLPFERMNDLAERTVAVQGGGYWLAEWEGEKITRGGAGDVNVRFLHPSSLIPEPGVFSDCRDMNCYFIVTSLPYETAVRKYGAENFGGEAEDEPVSVITAYHKDDGVLCKTVFTESAVLSDEEGYLFRKRIFCKKCGGTGYEGAVHLEEQTKDGRKPRGAENILSADRCPFCGSDKTVRVNEGYEILPEDISGAGEGRFDLRAGEKIPFYIPDITPAVLQKNISAHGSLLGQSDIDKIYGQQNILKRLSAKINDKLIKSGSYMTIPERSVISTDNEEMKVIRLRTPAEKSMIDVFNMEADITADLMWYERCYEEARKLIGITDSYLGREDNTAVSGTAKQISVNRSEGRLQSRRIMKNAAFSELFETIFKLKLAYADEKRPIVLRRGGEEKYGEFDRFDFLERDESGEYYWNDMFLFSAQSESGEISDRKELWSMARDDMASGAYGNPEERKTLLGFWTRMEKLRYPGAGEMREFFGKESEDENEKRE